MRGAEMHILRFALDDSGVFKVRAIPLWNLNAIQEWGTHFQCGI